MPRPSIIFAIFGLIALGPLGVIAPRASALEVRKAGKITVPDNAQVVPFSTDALVADVLRQDFAAEHRGADANATSPVTLSVAVTEHPLRPGISLQELAPGDPDVEALLKAAGATPPPVGDTGTDVDEAALARARAQNHMLPPGATPMQNLFNTIQTHGDLGPPLADPSGCVPGMPCQPPAITGTAPPPLAAPGTPGYTGDTQDYMAQGYEGAARRARRLQASDYDNVIVARVSISGSEDEMTVIAVFHPGENEHQAKKLIAEEIVNTALH
jgi:hypothetical protein